MKYTLLTLQSRIRTPGILLGIIASATMVLNTFADPTNCAPPPAGLVGWWRGEGNAADQGGTNNGTLVGDISYGAGRVGQALVFGGANGDGVTLGNPAALQLQDLSIEAWVKRASATQATRDPNDAGDGCFIGYGSGGYAFAVLADGSLGFTKAFYSYVGTGPGLLTDTSFHHVAVTKSGSTVVFYVDGAAYPVAAYDPGFTFSTTAVIGSMGDLTRGFWGTIDELSIYNRGLAAAEIQGIYNAGSFGKCLVGTPPTITSQPANQTVLAGGNVEFDVIAVGTQPFSYQWNFNGVSLSGATNQSLVLTNVQAGQAGTYTVLVTNLAGSILSSNAVLTVNGSQLCAAVPAGLVGWWRGEANAFDQVGTTNGTPVGNAAYGAGRVGQSFVFGGDNGDGVILGNPTALQLQDLSIEAWVKRASATQATKDPYDAGDGCFIGYGSGGYAFAVLADGSLGLSKAFYNYVGTGPGLLTDTNFHHVAVTKSGSTVVFYVDGVAYPVAPYNPGFTFATSLVIGSVGDLTRSFWGTIDELSIYNRGLGATEIQALYNAGSSGKCIVDTPPTITSQPANQTVFEGDYATFGVLVAGTQPLSYQWNLNGNSLPGATNSSLALPNVQPSQAGTYTVLVTNVAGSILSSNAVLTVNPPLPCTPPPAGLVSWWRGEGIAFDQVGTNNGTPVGNTTYGAGRVGQAFVFGGANGDGVTLGNPASLHLQDLSIEAWIKRASASQVTTGPTDGGDFFAYGSGGYAFAMYADGSLTFGKAYVSGVRSIPGLVTDTNWHHVAVSKSGSTVVYYVDGVAYPVAAYTATFTFTTTAAIGMLGDSLYGFWGSIDELSIYNRALAAAEVQAIYNAGSGGKCRIPTAPVIVAQPANQTVIEGGTARFTFGVGGTVPLSYQWLFNGTNIAGATGMSLTLSNVQPAQAGNYAVSVTNAFGSSLSSNALLTVNPPPPCVPPPSGLVGWWRGESNAWDQAGVNPGVLKNGAGFAAGTVGQAFNLNGTSQYVDVPSSSSLNPTGSISLEAWIYPRLPFNTTAAPIIKKAGEGSATQDGYTLELTGTSGVRFGVYLSGGRQWAYAPTAPLSLNQWSHVVGVFNGTNLAFYLNGAMVGTSAAVSGQMVTSGNNLQIGHDPSITSRYFGGLIDEASVYNTALSAAEIQAIYAAGASGKCPVAAPPWILVQPTNQSITVGSNVTFSVAAAGTPPLSYQWSFGGAALDGATNASLTLTNVQFSQAGNYGVVITNAGGTVSSSNATLAVNFPPAVVRVVSAANAPSGATVTVPVSLVANGNENGLSFSLNFDTAKLIYVSTALGSGASGVNLVPNATQATSGKLGVILVLGPDKTFAAGTQELVQVTFTTALLTNVVSTPVSFSDDPITRLLSDAPGSVLAATYVGGSVSIQAADFEGDLSPRPTGDKAILLTDWVMAGRYAARLDYPTNAAEFQRADCAPRSTLGDGAITVIDWVQVGLYAAGLDPLTAAGGPTTEVPPSGNISQKDLPPRTPQGDPPLARVLAVADTMVMQGLTGTVSVQLQSQGNENAIGFSLSFDPAVLSYVGASPGSAGNGATLLVNAKQAAAGRLGFVLGLGTGSSFAAGSRELINVTFRATAPDQGKYGISMANQPVPCEVSDTSALRLAAGYVNGTITVNPLPSLSIGRSGENITLTWPLWATNFGLQTAEGGFRPAVPWTNLVAVPNLTSNEAVVTLPLTATNRVYRLYQP